MKKISFASLLFACFVLLAATSARAQITNGSFESDYTGWTLVETPLNPCFGTWGIAANGFTLNPGGSVFDFTDNLNCVQNSPGLPITFAATDGNKLAFQLQNGTQFHRMFQDVALGPPATLHWDMQFHNPQFSFAALARSALAAPGIALLWPFINRRIDSAASDFMRSLRKRSSLWLCSRVN